MRAATRPKIEFVAEQVYRQRWQLAAAAAAASLAGWHLSELSGSNRVNQPADSHLHDTDDVGARARERLHLLGD